MDINTGFLKKTEEEKALQWQEEKKQMSDKEKTFQTIKQKQLAKQHSTMCVFEAINKELCELRELLWEWAFSTKDTQVIQKIIDSDTISQEQIVEIFDILDTMKTVCEETDIIPTDFQVTKEDYIKALTDSEVRSKVLTTVDKALVFISQKITTDSWQSVNLFSWMLAVLDKNLILVQEWNIDVKRSLQSL